MDLSFTLPSGKNLTEMIQNTVKALTESRAISLRLMVSDPAVQAISTKQGMHLLLIIREAVSNCVRHSSASQITLSLRINMRKKGVRLSIHDNGRGFNPDRVKEIGHGLRNMANRAQKIGGQLTVSSKINDGTRVLLDLPKEASSV